MSSYVWAYAAALWPMVAKYGLVSISVVGLTAFGLLAPWPLPRLKTLALVLAGCIACTAASYTVGVHDEYVRMQKVLDASLKLEAEQGREARTDAEQSVRAEPPDSVRNDVWNRDNWKEQGGD